MRGSGPEQTLAARAAAGLEGKVGFARGRKEMRRRGGGGEVRFESNAQAAPGIYISRARRCGLKRERGFGFWTES